MITSIPSRPPPINRCGSPPSSTSTATHLVPEHSTVQPKANQPPLIKPSNRSGSCPRPHIRPLLHQAYKGCDPSFPVLIEHGPSSQHLIFFNFSIRPDKRNLPPAGSRCRPPHQPPRLALPHRATQHTAITLQESGLDISPLRRHSTPYIT
ncbi:hypothetical protein BO99DRAFT_407163 [Aspergillus violaceofuscus CBS 115571]|uniref:Uncharacterized protein n=1 Tax=Aspergillus violaceofuscus (strain CBS 115571) TaxID=1450538 RepID=A0A2V5GZM1_ASPV1|nr:hypothetical protein BO99DRAFT_407163 [Aspergillus violaceofuscus CBS 115571]